MIMVVVLFSDSWSLPRARTQLSGDGAYNDRAPVHLDSPMWCAKLWLWRCDDVEL